MIQTAALVYVLIIAVVIVFQLCLIAGAPWGRLTQGGRHEGALPASRRIAAGLSIMLLAAMGTAIASSAGLFPRWPDWTGWVATGVQGLSTLLNWITPSRPERRLWGPVTTAMLALSAFVVLSPA